MEDGTELLLSGNTLAIAVACVSVGLSVVSLYFSRLKPGVVKVPPFRAYRVEPLNYNRAGETIRIFRLFLPLTLMNTGTYQRAISDLRVTVMVPSQGKLHLRWELEIPSLDADTNHTGSFAGQPTLQGYESTSLVYTFISPFQTESGQLVRAIEEQGDQGGHFRAVLEQRHPVSMKWQPLRNFRFDYSGANRIETDFDKINSAS